MLLFLAKVVYVLLALLFFPLDMVRYWLYNYMVRKEYNRLMQEAGKMFGGVKFEDFHQEQ